jgi:hypothetical protein
VIIYAAIREKVSVCKKKSYLEALWLDFGFAQSTLSVAFVGFRSLKIKAEACSTSLMSEYASAPLGDPY